MRIALMTFILPLSLRRRDHQLLLCRIDDEHGEQPRRLSVTGVFAHPMMGAGALNPRLAGPVDADRLAVDLAPDLARNDVGVDESRPGVTVRSRACPWGIVDDMADEALTQQIRDRLLPGDGGLVARWGTPRASPARERGGGGPRGR